MLQKSYGLLSQYYSTNKTRHFVANDFYAFYYYIEGEHINFILLRDFKISVLWRTVSLWRDNEF